MPFDKGGQNLKLDCLWNIVNTGKGQIDGYAYSEALADLAEMDISL